MFDEHELASAIEIQQRSYNLLRWVGDAIDRGFIKLERAHQYTTEADAAAAWISEHFENLPPDCRPLDLSDGELGRFSNFFSSYLLTSFELRKNQGEQLLSYCGCYCPICTYIGAAPHLKTRKVTPADKQRADRMKASLLQDLALNSDQPLDIDTALGLLADSTISRNAALVVYARELLRRCDGFSTGPAVLALWRQFAWSKAGSPTPNFKLTADDVSKAQDDLMEVLLNAEKGLDGSRTKTQRV